MDTVAKLFNINSSETCIFGGTIIDTDLRSGYNKDDMVPSKGKKSVGTRPGMFLYPTVKKIQNNFKAKSFPLSLMSTWINGFVANTKGLPKSDNACDDVNEFLDEISIIKFEQIFPSKNTGLMEKLCSFFRFYNTNDPILGEINSEHDDASKNLLVNKGVVCRQWLENPIPVRYVVRREGSKTSPDYLYFIGGSTDLLKDKPADIILTLQKLYMENIHENPYIYSLEPKSSKYKMWDSITDAPKDPEETQLFNTIKFYRIMCGIIFIRNYLYYAVNELGIKHITEFNGDSVQKVEAADILELYNEPYRYCKTVNQVVNITKNPILTIL